MADRPGIVVYFDVLDILDELTDEESGQLFRAILKYAATGEIPEFSDRGLRMIWKEQQRKIDRDIEKYEEKCVKSAYSTYCRECKRAEIEPLAFEEWRARYHRSTSLDGIDDRTIPNDQSDIQLKQKPQPETITEAVTTTTTEAVTTAEAKTPTMYQGLSVSERIVGYGEEGKPTAPQYLSREQEFEARREKSLAMLENIHTQHRASFP